MYAAGLADIFTETLQNARRADANRIRVAIGGPGAEGRPTVTDDGVGVADPAILLSFGENGWSEDLVRLEDAAGMGFLSLARRGCTVASRTRTPDGTPALGWRVELAPGHFLGETDAEVQADDGAPWPYGTAVTFQATESENTVAIRWATETAARHYPLTVMFEDVPDTPPYGSGISSRRSRPRGDVGNSPVGRMCEHLCGHARQLNPLSLAVLFVVGVEFSRVTVLHSATRQLKWARFRAAYSSIGGETSA